MSLQKINIGILRKLWKHKLQCNAFIKTIHFIPSLFFVVEGLAMRWLVSPLFVVLYFLLFSVLSCRLGRKYTVLRLLWNWEMHVPACQLNNSQCKSMKKKMSCNFNYTPIRYGHHSEEFLHSSKLIFMDIWWVKHWTISKCSVWLYVFFKCFF